MEMSEIWLDSGTNLAVNMSETSHCWMGRRGPRCDQHTPHVVLCEEEPDQGEAKGPSPDFMHLWVSVDGPQLPG